MVKHVRIMKLGDIVDPAINKAVFAFAQAIVKEKKIAISAASADIATVLKEQTPKLINPFKLGKLDEASFRQKMIAALKKQTGVELSLAAFNTAWNAMNPGFKDFQVNLETAAQYNKADDQTIVFISDTNPIDMRHLIDELKNNNYPYKLDNRGNLAAINGIPLKLSYVEQKPKDILFAEAILHFQATQRDKTTILSQKSLFNQPVVMEPVDIKLVTGVDNDIQDETILKGFQEVAARLKETAEKLDIAILPWRQKQQSFEAFLQNEPKPLVIFSSHL